MGFTDIRMHVKCISQQCEWENTRKTLIPLLKIIPLM